MAISFLHCPPDFMVEMDRSLIPLTAHMATVHAGSRTVLLITWPVVGDTITPSSAAQESILTGIRYVLHRQFRDAERFPSYQLDD
jgi:hypothetical protein